MTHPSGRFPILPSFSGLLAGALAMGILLTGTLWPDALSAQAPQPDTARQMRHFWHVFVAYAFAWILLMGWVIAILRRLRRVEDRLGG